MFRQPSLSEYTQRSLSRGSTKGRPRLCFVAPHAYPAISGRADLPHIGGAEIQQTLIARVLAHRGYSVCFVTRDHGQPDEIVHDGITVFKMKGRDHGLYGFRFFHPRWTSLWHAMARADADAYYQRAAGSETGQTALWCRLRRRPFLFAAASDTNSDPSLPDLLGLHERVLYRFGLRKATRVICQNTSQLTAFQSYFGVKGHLIQSCAADPFDGRNLLREPGITGRIRMLWIGRFHPKKRLEWLLELAASCPHLAFDLIGEGRKNDSYGESLVKQARRLSNVTLHGRIPNPEIGPFYDRADVLVCTSPWEGFPNTFLEAWSRGTPTVSTVDPGGVIAGNGLGAVAHSVAELRDAILYLASSPVDWCECSRRVRSYFLHNHTLSRAADAYESLLDGLST